MPLGWVSWRPILTQKNQTRVEIADSDKHSSLLQHGIVYDRKKFYSTGPRWSNLPDWSEGLEIRKVTNWDKKKLRKKGLDKLSDNGYFFKEFTRTGEKPGSFCFVYFYSLCCSAIAALHLMATVCWGRIFSHVQPFYEWAVSNQDRSMHRSLGV